MTLSEIAPAKLNLALHVRGKLPDGRHAIETVFAFCTDGDELMVDESDDLSLTIDGPFGADLDPGPDNLVIRAARALAEASGVDARGAMRLTKNLPVASGIGGGSADAAAALRLLTRFWSIDPAHATRVAPNLGSDVPSCLRSRSSRGSGAGDILIPEKIGTYAQSGAQVLLINPRIGLSTAAVFAKWDGIDRGPLIEWYEGRNDLEAPAQAIVPQIGDVRHWLLKRSGTRFVRMSGSGATCFAIFGDEKWLHQAKAQCLGEHPEWWCLATHIR